MNEIAVLVRIGLNWIGSGPSSSSSSLLRLAMHMISINCSSVCAQGEQDCYLAARLYD